MLEYIESVEETVPWFFPLLSFGLGACVGSFLNVCIYRIPDGLSIIHPGSRCGACGKPIPFYLNIPIFAWLILRGKTHCCGVPYSIRYPAVEALTGALFLAAWLLLPVPHAVIGFVWIAILVCITFIDLDHMLIPDRFSIGGLFLGVLFSILVPSLHGIEAVNAMMGGIQGMFTAIVGVLIGSSVILWIMILAELVLKKEALGFGDVKLMGAIGAFCGWQGTIFSLFGGALLGTLAIVAIQLIRLVTPGKKSGEEAGMIGREIPFGPMLAAGSLLYYLYMGPTVDWYFAQFNWVLTGG